MEIRSIRLYFISTSPCLMGTWANANVNVMHDAFYIACRMDISISTNV